MESTNSSPEGPSLGQTKRQAYADLLKSFQGVKSRRRGASKNPQPQSQESQGLAKSTSQPISKVLSMNTPEFALSKQPWKKVEKAANVTQQEFANGMRLSQEESIRKRLYCSPSMEPISESESPGNSETLPQAVFKRARLTPSAKGHDKAKQTAKSAPKKIEVQVHINPSRLNNEEKEAQTLHPLCDTTKKHIGRTLGSVAVKTSNPLEIKSNEGGTTKESVTGKKQQGKKHGLSPLTSVENINDFASRIMRENHKMTEVLEDKNQSFLKSIPVGFRSSFEAKLKESTSELLRLHQEQVDAIRLEYVAELQRDMDERQKVINVLLQQP